MWGTNVEHKYGNMRGDSNNAIVREKHLVHAECHLLQNGLLMFDCSVVLPCIETTRPDDHNGIDGTFKVGRS